MAYQLALDGNAPAWLRGTNAQGVPINSVLVSVFFAFVSVGLQWWNPPGLLAFLMSAVGGCLMVTWIMITLSYAKLRPTLAGDDIAVSPRWLPWVTLAALVAIVALMLFDAAARGQIIAVLALSAFLVLLSQLGGRRTRVRAEK